jgi:group I intron endonuclease
MGAVFALYSGWYFWIPKILGLDYNLLYSKAHFWVLFAGVNLTFFPQHFLGLQGMPRRVSDYPDAFTGWNFISSIGSIVSVAATALFLQIVYLQLVKGKAVFGYPWAVPQLFSDYLRILKDKSAPGLEWALHNPPKPHAFTSLPLQSVFMDDDSDLEYDENREKDMLVASKATKIAYLNIAKDRHNDIRKLKILHMIIPKIRNKTETAEELEWFRKNSVLLLKYDVIKLAKMKLDNPRMFKVTEEMYPLAIEEHKIDDKEVLSYLSEDEISKDSALLSNLKKEAFNAEIKKSVLSINLKYVQVTLISLLAILSIYINIDYNVANCDAPRAWGLYFQDSASPQMEALVELHDNIMYYLVAILFSVGWIQGAIIRNFDNSRSPISNKYLNHGKSVPIQKYFNYIQKKHYSTSSTPDSEKEALSTRTEINVIKLYENATLKKQIIDENKNKSGIYLLTNLLSKDQYVGQSIDLGKRFTKYFTLSYLKNRNTLVISRAFIKYGYANFSISILEYCDKDILNEKEQYYMDIIKPVYNTLKIAGSSSGYKHTQESKDKRSLSLKGKYIGTDSPLYGRTHTDETKQLMSSVKKGQDNPFFSKTHTDATKELMKQKATGRKHLPSTLEKMSKVRGNPVNIYEKCNSEGFKFIGSFISARKAGLFLGISGSTIIKYMHSGEIFKDRYKFSGKAPQ